MVSGFNVRPILKIDLKLDDIQFRAVPQDFPK